MSPRKCMYFSFLKKTSNTETKAVVNDSAWVSVASGFLYVRMIVCVPSTVLITQPWKSKITPQEHCQLQEITQMQQLFIKNILPASYYFCTSLNLGSFNPQQASVNWLTAQFSILIRYRKAYWARLEWNVCMNVWIALVRVTTGDLM